MDHLYNHPSFYDADTRSLGPVDIDFWLKNAENRRVLEVGCGTGRLSFPLGKICDLVALEMSKPMLDWAIDHQGTNPPITWMAGTLQDLTLDQPVDLILIPFNTFNHFLTREQQLAALTSCHNNLTTGGRLILDCFNPDAWSPFYSFKEVRSFKVGDREWTRHERHLVGDLANFILQIEYRSKGEETLELGVPLTQLWRYELQWLLEQSGFELISVKGDYDGCTFETFSPHILTEARRC